MRVLVACESSGVVREAFRWYGHDAWSADLQAADDGSSFHIEGDVLNVLGDNWDMMIAHPPCTYVCGSGLHWNKRRPERAVQTEAAIKFAEALWDAPIDRIAIENPVGCLSTRSRLGKASQYVQPYEFGHSASKKTGLWLKNLPTLVSTRRVAGRFVDGKERWDNQTDSGQNREGPSEERWKIRSKTYKGIAEAMASQWAFQIDIHEIKG